MYGIFTSIWQIFLVNVGKYTSPIDPMGITNPHFMPFSQETHLKINYITIYFSIKFDPPKNGACNDPWKITLVDLHNFIASRNVANQQPGHP